MISLLPENMGTSWPASVASSKVEREALWRQTDGPTPLTPLWPPPKGARPVTNTPHFHTCLNFVPASNGLGIQAGLPGWLVKPFEKRDHSCHTPILVLLIWGPFQPFQNVLFNPLSVFCSLVKGLSSSR